MLKLLNLHVHVLRVAKILLLLCDMIGMKTPTFKIHIYDFIQHIKKLQKRNKQIKTKTRKREKTLPNPITIELTFNKQLQYWTIMDIERYLYSKYYWGANMDLKYKGMSDFMVLKTAGKKIFLLCWWIFEKYFSTKWHNSNKMPPRDLLPRQWVHLHSFPDFYGF